MELIIIGAIIYFIRQAYIRKQERDDDVILCNAFEKILADKEKEKQERERLLNSYEINERD